MFRVFTRKARGVPPLNPNAPQPGEYHLNEKTTSEEVVLLLLIGEVRCEDKQVAKHIVTPP